MESWVFIPFESAVQKVTYTKKIPRKQFLTDGAYPIISQESDFINGYWDNSEDAFSVDSPVVIFGDHTKIIKHIDFDFVLGADGVKILKPIETLSSKFFAYFLNAAPVADLGYARHYRLLKEITVPVPPREEQERMVAILDEVFADIEQVRAKTEQNLKNARELFESYLQQVFSQRGEGWNIKQVSDIADTVLGKMLDKKKNKGTFKPYLRNLNVQWFDINTADLLDMRFEDSEYERYSIKKGDLVICEGGYPGRGAIWNNEEDIFFQKALHRVRSHKSIYNRWILYYLYLSDKNGELKKSFTGAGIQHFTGRALKALKIPVPTESMANKYIEKFDRIFNEVQLLENNYIRKLAATEELKKSILQKAFSGELTKKTSLEVAHD